MEKPDKQFTVEALRWLLQGEERMLARKRKRLARLKVKAEGAELDMNMYEASVDTLRDAITLIEGEQGCVGPRSE